MAEDRIERLSSLVSGTERLRLRIAGPAGAVTGQLEKIPGVGNVTYREPFHTVEFAAGAEPHGQITAALVERGWDPPGDGIRRHEPGGHFLAAHHRGSGRRGRLGQGAAVKNIAVIARKELVSYLTSPMAYVVTAVFLALFRHLLHHLPGRYRLRGTPAFSAF